MDLTKDVVITDDGCHEWTRSCSGSGYAQKTISGRYWSLHRYVYSLKDPLLSDSDVVRHLCHNRKCINPMHLEKGTHADNWNDSRCLHAEKAKLRRGSWSICGVDYGTVREASEATGVNQKTICKHTHGGVFDVVAYRNACYVARVKPRL